MPIQPYALPTIAHGRRHGPGGYKDYQTYKDWLRDEFAFRCAYCMAREKWEKLGDWTFHVEHRIPKVADPSKECDCRVEEWRGCLGLAYLFRPFRLPVPH
jgi:hypothetical protein